LKTAAKLDIYKMTAKENRNYFNGWNGV